MFRFKTLIYLACIVLLPLLFVGLPKGVLEPVRSLINKISVPVVNFSHQVFQKTSEFFSVFPDFWKIRAENERLVKEIEQLTLEVDRLRYLFDENARLLKLLDFADQTAWKTISARVIGRAPSQWNQSVWINRGSQHGLQEGMAVITVQGVAGKVVEVMPEWSRVLLLIDENCSLGAKALDSGEIGVIKGGGAGCVLQYLPRESKTKSGDQIISSGLSKFLPPGINIGTVVRVQDDALGLFQYAEVLPSVHFEILEEVLVILSKENTVSEK